MYNVVTGDASQNFSAWEEKILYLWTYADLNFRELDHNQLID